MKHGVSNMVRTLTTVAGVLSMVGIVVGRGGWLGVVSAVVFGTYLVMAGRLCGFGSM